MAVTRDLKPTLKLMRGDKKYKRLKESFDSSPRFQLPVEKLADEIEQIHNLREIRRLDPEAPAFVDNLVRANTKDQSARGRLTAIMMEASRSSSVLSRAVENLKYHLLVTFTADLKSFKTKDERSQIVNIALTPFLNYIADLGMLKESAMLVTADIDKGNWSLKLSVEALKIHSSKERDI